MNPFVLRISIDRNERLRMPRHEETHLLDEPATCYDIDAFVIDSHSLRIQSAQLRRPLSLRYVRTARLPKKSRCRTLDCLRLRIRDRRNTDTRSDKQEENESNYSHRHAAQLDLEVRLMTDNLAR